jgi:host factor-I protein
MTKFDVNLPSIKQIQTYIKDQQEVEMKLITDDLIVGKILWQDPNCVCLVDHYNQPTLIWRQALVYLKPKA